MNKKIITLLSLVIFCLYFLPAILFSQDMSKIDLGGTWKFRKAGTTKWMDAKVPGEVHLDLMKNNVISDPFFSDNESYQKWIGETGWEYKKVFIMPDSLFVKRNIELVCKGIDTYANVYLNDSLIIIADNMFRTWYSDIRTLLRTGVNTLRIQFPANSTESKSRYDKLNFKYPGDERVVCRKAAYQFGWDFAPSFITYGIWKPIYIRYWDFVNVLGVYYEQKSLTDTLARVNAAITFVSTLADTATFKIFLNDSIYSEKRFAMKKGANVAYLDIDIRNPKRWWTNGLGDPYLYRFRHVVEFEGKVVGEGVTKIGLRTIELDQKKDTLGHSFGFKLNGVPVFMKGANYVPQDVFLTRVKDSSYRELIKSAAEAHMNMLRVWGGGIYERDAFYDYCDEYGILVWQDFMFANAIYPEDKRLQQNIQAEAVQSVVRLHNHPCIAIWCGNNETDESWKNGKWPNQYSYSSDDSIRLNTVNFTMFNDFLRGIVRKFDAGTPYTSSSPKYAWEKPECLKAGDQHYWGVWDGKEPFSSYSKNVGRFVSEYGFQSFPEMGTIQKFSNIEDLKPDSPVMKAHQKYKDGNALMDDYIFRYYKSPKNFASYIYLTQLLQAEAAKTAIEAHRRGMPYCMGSLYFQLNDCWPGITWSAIDYYGKKKALMVKIGDLFAQTMVSPVIEDQRFKIYVISDSLHSRPAELCMELIDFTGKTLMNATMPVEIPANNSRIVLDTSLQSIIKYFKTKEIVLYISLKSNNRIIAKNSLYFELPKELDLQLPDIQKKITETTDGYTVELSTDKFAKDVYVKMPFKGELSENYFDLIPGRPKTLVYLTKTHFGDISKMIRITSVADTY
jgi:beta-mannosidase